LPVGGSEYQAWLTEYTEVGVTSSREAGQGEQVRCRGDLAAKDVGELASARAGNKGNRSEERTSRGTGPQDTASLRLENQYYSHPSGSWACLVKSQEMKIVQGYSGDREGNNENS